MDLHPKVHNYPLPFYLPLLHGEGGDPGVIEGLHDQHALLRLTTLENWSPIPVTMVDPYALAELGQLLIYALNIILNKLGRDYD